MFLIWQKHDRISVLIWASLVAYISELQTESLTYFKWILLHVDQYDGKLWKTLFWFLLSCVTFLHYESCSGEVGGEAWRVGGGALCSEMQMKPLKMKEYVIWKLHTLICKAILHVVFFFFSFFSVLESKEGKDECSYIHGCSLLLHNMR